MKILPDKHGPSFRTTDHGLKCADAKGDILNILCVACSRPGQRRWACVRVACANGETVEIVATGRTTTVTKFKRKGKR